MLDWQNKILHFILQIHRASYIESMEEILCWKTRILVFTLFKDSNAFSICISEMNHLHSLPFYIRLKI